MSDNYERVLERAKAVLSQEHRDILGSVGLNALYDAVMIMAFADGDVCDEETRFLNDFSTFLGCTGTDDDLTPESLLSRLTGLKLEERASEAMLKVLLIVSNLDDDIDDDEMALWHDIGESLGITKERRSELRALLGSSTAS